MAFSPVKASEHITDKYGRYLRTIFSTDNDCYNKQLQDSLNNMKDFSAGPYLDVSDSFEKGKSLEELITEGLISSGFRRISMPLSRPLYKHQEMAIRKVARDQNLIVSTGTGSGKTESFLIPVLNHILREHEQGKLNKGVRALLIYPMNALANDQVERLRALLADCPEITYGSYTGQTKETYRDALAEYKQLNDGAVPKSNELISREQMKVAPPHILITNYAMLEYLMVRPGDSVFFEDANARKWKYIVLDEAHVYSGSSGIEVAMLLRRLKARLNNDRINYILTSATLGDEKSNEDVAAFGVNLCNSPFSTENIVRAFRVSPGLCDAGDSHPADFYKELASLLEQENDDAASAMIAPFVKRKQQTSVDEQIYEMLLASRDYAQLKRISASTRTIREIAREMNWTEDALVDFVAVASRAEKNGDRLFDARYHMFLRATESVFITLQPSNKLFLTRKNSHVEPDGTDFHVFEIATCRACHAIYLIGAIKDNILVQSSFQNEDDLRSVFLLKNRVSDTDSDHTMEEEAIEAEEYEICARCGYVRKAGRVRETTCQHGNDFMVKAYRVQTKKENGALTKCLACENTASNGILRMFFTGQEAVTSVLGTALFEELPSYKYVNETVSNEEDDFGFGFDEDFPIRQKVSEAKQFIAFSDSRQAAAFYASYFDQTYRNILYKRLLVEAIKGNRTGVRMVAVEQFIENLTALFEKYNISNEGQNEKEAWKAILQEMVDNNGATSLSNSGLIGFSFDREHIRNNAKLNLSQEDVGTLFDVFMQGMMTDAAIHYEYNMTENDRKFFAHNGVEYAYTLSDPDPARFRKSFIPRFLDKNNKRADYLRRILEKSKPDMAFSQEQTNKILESIWNGILIRGEYLKHSNGAYRLNCSKIRVGKPEHWYICSKCKKITPHNAWNVCPSYMCEGELQPIDPEQVMKDNHYFRLYQDMDIRGIRIVEHTAQLNKETAYEYQKEFKKKNIDILSCSTTFEMGVDVGSLETVFMRNMPPSPANYAQRAGRAGRSKKAAAFALTFCNKSNHDFSYFLNPERMIKGRIDPPKFNVENDKIAVRHVYASALSYFWQRYPQYFSSAADMAETGDGERSGVDAFGAYLLQKPLDLQDYLKAFLPASLNQKLGIEDYSWLEPLIGDSPEAPGVLTKAVAEYNYEVDILRRAKEEALKKNGFVDSLTQRIRVYQNEDILSFLSRKNVMPKYGFPVDTVELSIVGNNSRGKMGLQLQRDLSMAISEYAPGSQIVANGNLITSSYIRKVPRMSWKMYDYITCECKTLNIDPHVELAEYSNLQTCHQCGKTLDPEKRRVFLIPSFGFEASGDHVVKPGLRRPMRTYRGEIAYVGYREKIESRQHRMNGCLVETAMSHDDEMAVINESNFYVCETCGFTDLDEKTFTRSKRMKHKNTAGYWCKNDGRNMLKRFSLGYRFKTDVLQIRFIDPDVAEWETALSLLYAVIRGACAYLSIDQDDVAGCVQYFYNEATQRANFSLILYDKTPGGAGHVRRIGQGNEIEAVLKSALSLMKSCTCGGENMDSSCYACLRSYYNQKYHDILRRDKVIHFLEEWI